MAHPPKIVCIGAGSAIFGLSNLATIIRSRRLRGAEVALVDIDDIGMCQATLPAFADLVDFGLVSSGAAISVTGHTQRQEAGHNDAR